MSEQFVCLFICLFASTHMYNMLNIVTFQASNHSRIISVFSPLIINNKMLTPHQSSELVLYLIERWKDIFTVPYYVERAVKARVNLLVRGQSMPPMGM